MAKLTQQERNDAVLLARRKGYSLAGIARDIGVSRRIVERSVTPAIRKYSPHLPVIDEWLQKQGFVGQVAGPATDPGTATGVRETASPYMPTEARQSALAVAELPLGSIEDRRLRVLVARYLCQNCNRLIVGPAEGGKFCLSCGVPIMLQCSGCGKEAMPDDKFCSGCGRKFDTEEEERRA